MLCWELVSPDLAISRTIVFDGVFVTKEQAVYKPWIVAETVWYAGGCAIQVAKALSSRCKTRMSHNSGDMASFREGNPPISSKLLHYAFRHLAVLR